MLYKGYKQAIRNIRDRNGLSQGECARRVGINSKKWSQYETGNLKLTEKVLPLIREALMCTETQLWQESVRTQSEHYYRLVDEVREEEPQYGTTMAAGILQGLWALDAEALPHEDQAQFNQERAHLAAGLSSLFSLVDLFKDRYWQHLSELRRAQEEEEEEEEEEDDDDA